MALFNDKLARPVDAAFSFFSIFFIAKGERSVLQQIKNRNYTTFSVLTRLSRREQQIVNYCASDKFDFIRQKRKKKSEFARINVSPGDT